MRLKVMISDLEKYIYAKLDAMQTEKAKSTVIPNFVTKGELLGAISKDARKVLNKMFVEKKIKIHPTKDAPINDFVELVKEN